MQINVDFIFELMNPLLLVETWSIVCTGIVQAVGFRPAVARLAVKHRVNGKVANIDGDVLIEIQGRPPELNAFVEALVQLPPPIKLDPLRISKSVAKQFATFEIASSLQTGQARVEITPDQAICADCAEELQDPRNRRARYSQISCNSCGPRLGAFTRLPFDRETTTYSEFKPCSECFAEYQSSDSRRFHGQLVSCPVCGPKASLLGTSVPDHEVASEVAQRIARGEIGLVKGLCGVHLVCRADDESAVNKLRSAKARPAKPFAVMVRSLGSARRLAILTESAEDLLESAIRPVLVAQQQSGTGLAESVAHGLFTIGLMLPSSGFYLQLLDSLETKQGYWGGIVCTSANISGQAVPAELGQVDPSIAALVDFQVDHDRRILISCDDSVFLATSDPITPVRLGRGATPQVLRSSVLQSEAIGLGYGPKAAICTMDSQRLTLWPHLGSGFFNTREQFREAISTVARLSLFTPRVAGIDMGMPETFVGWVESEGWATERIQHHHAHAVSVAVEHGLIPEPTVLGLVCDGFGLGQDGKGWGGEVLEFDFASFRRRGGVRSTHHPAGIDRRVSLLAHSFLRHAGVPASLRDLLAPLPDVEVKLLSAASDGRISGAQGGSTGRLFDCLSALLKLSCTSAYEGQPAILLEQLATMHESRRSRPQGFPRFLVADKGGFYELDERPFFAALAPLISQLPSAEIAYWFHIVLAEGFVDIIERSAASCKQRPPIVLSGGCMQNSLFVSSLSRLLTDRGYKHYLPRRLPANDGGISVGLARIAGVRFQARKK